MSFLNIGELGIFPSVRFFEESISSANEIIWKIYTVQAHCQSANQRSRKNTARVFTWNFSNTSSFFGNRNKCKLIYFHILYIKGCSRNTISELAAEKEAVWYIFIFLFDTFAIFIFSDIALIQHTFTFTGNNICKVGQK